jgi:co-chaperonin GroES (HSP10)
MSTALKPLTFKADEYPTPARGDLARAFPAADPGILPFGSRILVQVRRAEDRIGSIHIADETKEIQKWNTQVAKVIALGPLAFRSRQVKDGEEFPKLWPEGEWCRPGDYVRVPKYGGDRWEVATTDGRGDALFVIYNDLDLIGKVTGDPLAVKAYV